MRTILLSMTAVLTLLAPNDVVAGIIMFGGLGGHGISSGPGASKNDGSLATFDQMTGAVSIIGNPGFARLSGLAFDPTGALWATTQVPGGFPPPPGPTGASNLIRINPTTGALLANIGPITAGVGGPAISIADLATQPGTGALFGIRGPQDQLGGQGKLYTINKTTGVATLVGDTGDFFGSIAFAPNGTLYMSAADLDFATDNLINISLKTLNPANAAVLTSVLTGDPSFYGALGIRPTDGVIFGGNGDGGQLFTVNPITGKGTLVGSTGLNFVGDLDFSSIPEPGTFALCALGCAGLIAWRRGNLRPRV